MRNQEAPGASEGFGGVAEGGDPADCGRGWEPRAGFRQLAVLAMAVVSKAGTSEARNLAFVREPPIEKRDGKGVQRGGVSRVGQFFRPEARHGWGRIQPADAALEWADIKESTTLCPATIRTLSDPTGMGPVQFDDLPLPWQCIAGSALKSGRWALLESAADEQVADKKSQAFSP